MQERAKKKRTDSFGLKPPVEFLLSEERSEGRCSPETNIQLAVIEGYIVAHSFLMRYSTNAQHRCSIMGYLRPLVVTACVLVLLFQPFQGLAESPTSPTTSSIGEVSLNPSIVFMLLFIGVLVLVFFWEPLPLYALALLIPVFLMVFQPWTHVSLEKAISGFSSPATIAILAMFVLSEGVQRTGLIQILGDRLSEFTGDSETRQIASVSALSGPLAGFINNTPVVAIFIPMVSNMARRVKTSPSKLMIPLSFASMMGGTLTLIGSSTNLLASDLSAELINHPIGFFEFTLVGVVILVTGSLYLVFFGKYLLPERIDPEVDLVEEYEMGEFLTELVITKQFEHLGNDVKETLERMDVQFDLVQIVRDHEQYMEPLQIKTLRERDRLVVRTDRENLIKLLNHSGIRIFSRERVSEEQMEEPVKGQTVVQAVVPTGSFLEGQTLKDVNFEDRYDTTVLAVRRGEQLTHRSLLELTLHAGDVLLLLATERTLNRLRQNRNFIVEEEIESGGFREEKTPVALGILVGVIFLAAIDWLPIAVAALGGAVLMVATGCVDANQLHESVDWEVVFLLAGLIPLGSAMQETGTARYLASYVLEFSQTIPPLGVLALFYFFTAVMTNLIHKNASIVIMIPVAVSAASTLGLEPFPFLITVMFAASTAFLTPIGNHTNLMVYGPGGYRFSDFLKVGLPLQVLLAVVTPIVVSELWTL